jgi:hypothetical protein
VAGRQPPPTVVGPPPPSPPPLPPGQCFPIMGDAGATGLPAQLELLQSRGVNDYVNDSLTLSSAAALANLQAPDECTLVRTLPLRCPGVDCRQGGSSPGKAREGRTKAREAVH